MKQLTLKVSCFLSLLGIAVSIQAQTDKSWNPPTPPPTAQQTPPVQGPPPESDTLGREWSEQEIYGRAYHGTWVRRGTTNVFDARWETGSAILTITIAGDNVSISRVHAGSSVTCQYEGQLQADHVTVKGTYRCTQMSSDGQWSAVIGGNVAGMAGGLEIDTKGFEHGDCGGTYVRVTVNKAPKNVDPNRIPLTTRSSTFAEQRNPIFIKIGESFEFAPGSKFTIPRSANPQDWQVTYTLGDAHGFPNPGVWNWNEHEAFSGEVIEFPCDGFRERQRQLQQGVTEPAALSTFEYKLGNVDNRVIFRSNPDLPEAARAAKASGTVTLQVSVDFEGKVTSAKALSGHPLLRSAAEASANTLRFTPYYEYGQVKLFSGTVTIYFNAP